MRSTIVIISVCSILTLTGVHLADSVDECGSLGRFAWFLVIPTVIQFLIEPIYKVWFSIRNTVGDSKIELPIKPIMPER